ncbi:MAG TPA: ABC transporter permease [Puia sp.]|nr:ABC transporter permease [Puia sp.]
MYRSYLKFAWRNLLKDRQFSLLNLLGLSVGLACALLIGLWIRNELDMEKYNPNDARLYQVMTNSKTSNGIQTGMYTPGILARALRAEFPEVEDASTVLPGSWFNDPTTPSGVLSFGEKKLNATPQLVDSNFFHLFRCPILEGDRRKLFADKQGVLLSAAIARSLFGTTTDLIGKVVHFEQYDFTGNYEIRGIFEPNPANATEQPDLLFNFDLALEKKGPACNSGITPIRILLSCCGRGRVYRRWMPSSGIISSPRKAARGGTRSYSSRSSRTGTSTIGMRTASRPAAALPM